MFKFNIAACLVFPPSPATLRTGLAEVAGLDDRGVREGCWGGRTGGLTEAGPAVGSPAMEVSRGGAEQSEADTALVTASVVAATSCTVRVRSGAN